MKLKPDTEELFKVITEKSSLKNKVYNNTLYSFDLIKDVITNLSTKFSKYQDDNKSASTTTFVAKPNGKFEIDLKFSGDVLLIMMHTNVFEFPRDHEVMRTPYIKADTNRSYCGIINIYNFLADSFKYNRVNDIGYLIGRIFINKDNHYLIEGKRELGLLYNDLGKNLLDEESAETIIKAAIKYTVNFDLLTPHYDLIKFVQVNEMKSKIDTISLKTGKRLGYKFSADED